MGQNGSKIRNTRVSGLAGLPKRLKNVKNGFFQVPNRSKTQ
jgi:hypothetical protein